MKAKLAARIALVGSAFAAANGCAASEDIGLPRGARAGETAVAGGAGTPVGAAGRGIGGPGGRSQEGGAAGGGGRAAAGGGALSQAGFASGGVSASAGNGGQAGGSAGLSGGEAGEQTAGFAGAAGEPAVDSRRCAQAASGIAITPNWDPLGYAPYALLDCTLAYVDTGGALELRNLATGSERTLAAAEEFPSRPTLAPGVVAWEVQVDGHSQVRVFDGTRTTTLSGAFDHAGEPRASDGTVVFTAWMSDDTTGDTDVLLFDLETGDTEVVFGGPAQQRFADVTPEFVAASDFIEDPAGHFDERSSLSDIAIFDRRSGTQTRRSREGKQAFPVLGENGALGYLEWSASHPEPKFGGFTLLVGRAEGAPAEDVLVRVIESDPKYVRPAAHGDYLDFVDRSSGSPLLYRTHFDTPHELYTTTPLDSVDLLGPVALPEFTLLGIARTTGIELGVVAR
jgi:hypothetical protein